MPRVFVSRFTLVVFFFALPLFICRFASAQTNFGFVNLGSSSSSISVPVTLSSSTPVTGVTVVTSGIKSAEFTDATGGTCAVGSSYPTSCTVQVKFAPQFAGIRYGAVVVSAASGVIGTAWIQGTGLGAQLTFLPANVSGVGGGYVSSCGSASPAVDAAGNLFIADCTTNVVREELFGQPSSSTSLGTGLSHPTAVAIDGAGNLYIADSGNARVVKETLNSTGYVQSVVATGVGNPTSVAVDGSGAVYVSDYAGGVVYKETPSGASYTQSVVDNSIRGPLSLAVNSTGVLYVANNTTVYAETLTSGKYGQSTAVSGFAVNVLIASIAVDSIDNLYISVDSAFLGPSGVVYKETPGATGFTQTALDSLSGSFLPSGLTIGGDGTVYIMLTSGGMVAEVFTTPHASLRFANSSVGLPSSDSPQTIRLGNNGNAPLQFSAVQYPVDFPEASGVATDCTVARSILPGATCTVSVTFTPSSGIGTHNESVVLTDNNSTTAGVQQTFAVTGYQALPTPKVTVTSSTTQTTSVTPITFTFTVSPVSGGPTPTGKLSVYDGIVNEVVTLDSNGMFTYTTGVLPVGSYSISASYQGDANYSASGGSFTALIIGGAGGTAAPASFPNTNVGATSSAIPVTVTFTQAEVLGSIAVLTQGTANLDFLSASGGSCATGAAYGVGVTCTVNVTFSPRVAGVRTGAVVLQNASGANVAVAYLQGTGVGPLLEIGGTFPVGLTGSSVSSPRGLAVDAAGDVFVADANTGLLEETPNASGGYTQTVIYASGQPSGVAVDGVGNIFVSEQSYAGPVAGVYLGTKSKTGGYTWTQFSNCCASPSGVAVDGKGNVYIADFGATGHPGGVYKETLTSGNYVRSAIGSGWSFPTAIAVDGSGNVYVTDLGTYNSGTQTGNGFVTRETLQPDGSYVQSAVGSGWYYPTSIAVDRVGNLYIDNNSYYPGAGSSAGILFTAHVLLEETPKADGSYSSLQLDGGTDGIMGVTVDDGGSVYFSHISDGVCSCDVSSVESITRVSAAPGISFGSTWRGSTSSDSPKTVTLSNGGNAAVTFTAVTYPTDFPEVKGVANDCAVGTPLVLGGTCTLTIAFSPVASLGSNTSAILSEMVTLSGTGIASGTQNIPLNGTEQQPIAVSPLFSVGTGTYNSAQTLTLTTTTPGASIYYSTTATPPGASTTLYTGPITVSSSTNFQAITIAPGYGNSTISSASIAITPPADFTLTAAPSTMTIVHGGSATTVVQVAPVYGFNSAVAFACSGLRTGATCSFSPATVTPNGTNTASTTLTVSTLSTISSNDKGFGSFGTKTLAPLFAVALFFVRTKRRRLRTLLVAVVALGAITAVQGCSSGPTNNNGGGGGTTFTPFTATFTVTATSGAIQHTATVTMNVN